MSGGAGGPVQGVRERAAWALLEGVMDPEIPMLSVVDLGIVRSVAVEGQRVHVQLTPTYSGCPATEVIEADVERALRSAFPDVAVETVLSPPWTTDWITERGRVRLREAGIAPPGPRRGFAAAPAGMRTLATVGETPAREEIACPRCGSTDVEEISRFGSTACKSLWRCRACSEPFDHFKPL